MPVILFRTPYILQSRPCSSKFLNHKESNNARNLLKLLLSRPCSSKIFNHSESINLPSNLAYAPPRSSIIKHQTMQVLPPKLFISYNLVHAPTNFSIIKHQASFYFQNKIFNLQASNNASFPFPKLFISSNLAHTTPSLSIIKHQTMPFFLSKTLSILQSRPCSSKLFNHQVSNNAIFSFKTHILSSNLAHAPPSIK